MLTPEPNHRGGHTLLLVGCGQYWNSVFAVITIKVVCVFHVIPLPPLKIQTHTCTGFFFHPPFSFSFLSFLMVSFTVFLVSFTFLHFCRLHSCLPCCLNSSLCWSSFLSQLNWDMTTAKHPGIFILSVFPDVAAGAQGWSQNLGVTRDSPSLPQSFTRKVSISIQRALALPSYVHSHCPTQQETEHKERERDHGWKKRNRIEGHLHCPQKDFVNP